jgi:glycosyltransferase involved in cell wall biosynthesis
MKVLIVATSKKPPSFEEEIKNKLRYRLDYLELCNYFQASYVDYDSPWMHENQTLRQMEERIHLDFHWARSITRLVNEQKYDLVISMSERMAVPLGLMLPQKVKHIAMLQNALSRKWLSLIRFSKVHRNWAKIIMFSHAEAEVFRCSLGIDPAQITTIHSGVDLEFYDPAIVKPLEPRSDPFILSQGLARRDYPTLIQALWKLPHVKCHISAVSAWDKYKAGYEGLQIPENVIIKAYDHPSKIRDALAECQFLVIPLKPDVGMWCAGSTSVLEAQAMGKPVVVTQLPGISEYAKPEETGLFAEGNNPSSLAEKIDWLWRNPDRARTMGQNGQMWIRENFSLKTWIHKIADVVEELSVHPEKQAFSS